MVLQKIYIIFWDTSGCEIRCFIVNGKHITILKKWLCMAILYTPCNTVNEVMHQFIQASHEAESAGIHCQERMTALQARVHAKRQCVRHARKTPLQAMQACRDALNRLDDRGWNRSYHQRLFHDDFLKACTRIFWKTEPPGSFSRDHQRVLRENNWTHLSQEVLVRMFVFYSISSCFPV